MYYLLGKLNALCENNVDDGEVISRSRVDRCVNKRERREK